MKIPDRLRNLVISFLEAEANDYHPPRASLPTNVMSKIDRELEKYKEGADYLVIRSMSNVGLINRQLFITPSPWNEKGILTITLCTCGRDNCWGTIEFSK